MVQRLLTFTVALAVTAFASQANAQVWSGTGPGGAIPDNNVAGVSFTLNAPNLGNVVGVSIDFGGLAHTWVGDLVMTLTHVPSNTTMTFFDRPGRATGTSTFGYSSDFLAANSYSFADGGTQFIFAPVPASVPSGTYEGFLRNPDTNANGPYPGNYVQQSFAGIFGGLAMGGDWTLNISDREAGDIGAFGDWTLNIQHSVIPEPSIAALGVLGLVGLVVRRRRR